MQTQHISRQANEGHDKEPSRNIGSRTRIVPRAVGERSTIEIPRSEQVPDKRRTEEAVATQSKALHFLIESLVSGVDLRSCGRCRLGSYLIEFCAHESRFCIRLVSVFCTLVRSEGRSQTGAHPVQCRRCGRVGLAAVVNVGRVAS